MLIGVAQGGKSPQICNVSLISSSLRPFCCFLLLIERTSISVRTLVTTMAISAADAHHHVCSYLKASILDCILVVRRRNALLQKTDYKCSHPDQTSPCGKLRYHGTKTSSLLLLLGTIYDRS